MRLFLLTEDESLVAEVRAAGLGRHAVRTGSDAEALLGWLLELEGLRSGLLVDLALPSPSPTGSWRVVFDPVGKGYAHVCRVAIVPPGMKTGPIRGADAALEAGTITPDLLDRALGL